MGWWRGDAAVAARVRGWVEEVAATGGPVRATSAYWTGDGRERVVDLTVQGLRGESGAVEHVVPTGLDITDHVAAERRAAAASRAAVEAEASTLRAVQAELSRTLLLSERVLDNVDDGLYGLDLTGRVEFVNLAAGRMTGWSRDEQLGRDMHALIHDRRADGSPYPVEECPIWRAMRSGRTVVAPDEVFWHRDGTAVPVELTAVPVVAGGEAVPGRDAAPAVPGGEVAGVVVSFRDLTDRRAAERQADELRRVSEQAAVQRALSDRLQRALLTPPPEPDHLHVVVRYTPASHDAQVGGDWYDAFLQPDGATVLVIGDVLGHDSDAAAAMGQLRGLLRALAYDDDEALGATLSRAERAAQGLLVSTLATVVLARVERAPGSAGPGAARRLHWSNAGHPPPVLLLPDGTTRLLDVEPDLMLGVDPGAPRHDHVVDLPDGATLLLVTDGLVERRGAGLDEGLDALCTALADLGHLPLDDLCDALLARLLPGDGEDDVALLAVRAHPEDAPRPAEAGPNVVPDGLA